MPKRIRKPKSPTKGCIINLVMIQVLFDLNFSANHRFSHWWWLYMAQHR